MKKKVVSIFLIMLFILSGCTNKVVEDKMETLKKDLNEKAKEIFGTDEWTKGGVKEGTYTVTLRDIKEKMNKDVSEYKNPDTNKECDLDKTKIDFIVSTQKEEGKTNYKIKITLVCD